MGASGRGDRETKAGLKAGNRAELGVLRAHNQRECPCLVLVRGRGGQRGRKPTFGAQEAEPRGMEMGKQKVDSSLSVRLRGLWQSWQRQGGVNGDPCHSRSRSTRACVPEPRSSSAGVVQVLYR